MAKLERKPVKGDTNRTKSNAGVVTIDSETEVEQRNLLINNEALEYDDEIRISSKE